MKTSAISFTDVLSIPLASAAVDFRKSLQLRTYFLSFLFSRCSYERHAPMAARRTFFDKADRPSTRAIPPVLGSASIGHTLRLLNLAGATKRVALRRHRQQ